MSAGGDYLVIAGSAYNHPKIRNGKWTIPGIFVSFDEQEMIGVSKGGTKWHLSPEGFQPNGNAQNLQDAISYINKNWLIS